MGEVSFSAPGTSADFEFVFVTNDYLAAVPDIGLCIYCDTSIVSPLTVTLPGGPDAEGKIFVVKMVAPIAPGATVEVVVDGLGFIDLAPNYTIATQDQSVMFQCVATGFYYVISDYNPGGGGVGDLQAVTALGATTTIPITVPSISLGVVSTVGPAYIVLATDTTVLADTTGNNIAITMPAGAAIVGKLFTIKNININRASIFFITITSAGGIDGGATYRLSRPLESVVLQCTSAGGQYRVWAPNPRFMGYDRTFLAHIGATINIPVLLGGFTPLTAYIQAKNAAAAIVLQGGYYISTLSSALMTVTFLVPVAAPTDLEFYYGMTWDR